MANLKHKHPYCAEEYIASCMYITYKIVIYLYTYILHIPCPAFTCNDRCSMAPIHVHLILQVINLTVNYTEVGFMSMCPCNYMLKSSSCMNVIY